MGYVRIFFSIPKAIFYLLKGDYTPLTVRWAEYKVNQDRGRLMRGNTDPKTSSGDATQNPKPKLETLKP